VRFTKLTPVIYAADLHAEARFYTELGFEARYPEGDAEAGEMGGFVALRQGEVEFGVEFSDRFRARAANDTVLWQFQIDDLAEAARLCERLGLRHTAPRRDWERPDAWEMRVTSPNGYEVSLEGPMPARHQEVR